MTIDDPVKSRNSINLSFRRKPESSYFNIFWTPAFAGVTIQDPFYEIITIDQSPMDNDH